jgi:orotate phosphoribosyltransferase
MEFSDRTNPMVDVHESLQELLEESGAFKSGHFQLSAGGHSPAYVQCALLLQRPDHASRVGQLIASRLEEYAPEAVISPALGGLVIGYEVARSLQVPFRFTERVEGVMTLRRGFTVQRHERIVIVEDVVTTGKSTLEVATLLQKSGAEVCAIGSILDRTGGDSPFQTPFESLMSLDLPTYEADSCPLCAAQIPLDSPGSRLS